MSALTYYGKGVAVHAPKGSYAARRAAAELSEAEKAIAALEDLLAAPREHRGRPIHIYLADGVAGQVSDPAATRAEPGILRVLSPDAPAEAVAYSLTGRLVERWFGPKAASASLFVNGIAGVVAGRTGAGPTREDVDELVRVQRTAVGDVSIFKRGRERDNAADQEGADPLATSFVGFLLEVYGAERLREFLAAYDPARRDQALSETYHRPLGSLEELWLTRLLEPSGGRSRFRALASHLVPLMKAHRLRWAEIIAYTLLGVAYTIAIPLAFKYLFDTVIPGGSPRLLALFVAALLGILVANTFITVRRSYVTALVNQRILLGLQEAMFERLQQLSHAFYARAKVGDLMSRLSSDLNAVGEAMTAVLAQGGFLVLSAVAAAVAAMVLSPLLGALVLVVVPLFSLTYLVLLSRLRRASHEVQTIYGQVAASIQENLSAHSLIKAFGLEQRAVSSYHGRLGVLLAAILRVALLGSLFEGSVGMAVTMGQLLVVGVGGYLVIEGSLTLGTLVAFAALLPAYFQPIVALSNVGQQLQHAAAAMERILEVVDQPIGVSDRPGAVPLPPLSDEIRLENVNFAYDPPQWVLRDVSMVIPAGSHVAIVGLSGSGKSTIVNLLLRFWDPQEGRVLMDGHDVRDLTLGSVRGQIGLVFQDTFAFDTTLRQNIALAREGATDAEVMDAARAARLEGWVASLPAGADTVLGERGVRMSGGQRQRLAIARAILRDPSILILDEATSALDAQTEAEILETLDEMAKGRTTISITHRLSLAARSDRIFVLEQGRIVEEGTHAELARAGGPYQRLHDEQSSYLRAGLSPIEVEVARLRAIPLLSGLGPEELADLSGRLTAERYAAGEEVFRQGDEGRKLYFVASGQVEVVLVRDGRVQRVTTLNQGDYFGEMALLADEPRAATARTMAPSELYSLSRSDLLSLLEHDAHAREVMEQAMALRRRALAEATEAASGGRRSAVSAGDEDRGGIEPVRHGGSGTHEALSKGSEGSR